MMANDLFPVQFTKSSKEDLREILRYIMENDDAGTAKQLVNTIRKQGESQLKTLPLRGKVVPELQPMTKEYRQILVKPYRIIYRVMKDKNVVTVLVVAHTKRSIEDMLLDRLIFNQ